VHKPLYINYFDDKYKALNLEEMKAGNAYQYWINLSFSMSFTSLLISPNNIESIREEDGLVVTTKGSRLIRIPCDNVLYFDTPYDNSYDVHKYFNVRSCKSHGIERIDDDDNLVSRIDLYPSERKSVTTTKDLVSHSVMTREQLLDPDWGNGIVRLKTLRMMDSAGITGPLSMERGDKKYYKKPKIEFAKRVVSERVKPLYSIEEINAMEQVKGEAWTIVQKLKQR